MLSVLIQVASGGAVGASLRYLVNLALVRGFGSAFPLGTLSVNVIGSFVMGILVVFLAHRSLLGLNPFLMTGLLGGFTTFSSFSLDVFLLWERGEQNLALIYTVASLVLSVLALVAGVFLTRWVIAG